MSRYLRAAFWAALLVTFALALMPQPPQLPGAPSDKVQHILAFAFLAALARAAYPRAPLLWLLAGLSAYGALIEIFQMIPALNRYAETADWIADTLAAAATLLAIELWRRHSARRNARHAAE